MTLTSPAMWQVAKLTTILNILLLVTCCINVKRMRTSRIDWVYITNGERNVQLIQLHNLVLFPENSIVTIKAWL
jgi:hypothetical protein